MRCCCGCWRGLSEMWLITNWIRTTWKSAPARRWRRCRRTGCSRRCRCSLRRPRTDLHWLSHRRREPRPDEAADRCSPTASGWAPEQTDVRSEKCVAIETFFEELGVQDPSQNFSSWSQNYSRCIPKYFWAKARKCLKFRETDTLTKDLKYIQSSSILSSYCWFWGWSVLMNTRWIIAPQSKYKKNRHFIILFHRLRFWKCHKKISKLWPWQWYKGECEVCMFTAALFCFIACCIFQIGWFVDVQQSHEDILVLRSWGRLSSWIWIKNFFFF